MSWTCGDVSVSSRSSFANSNIEMVDFLTKQAILLSVSVLVSAVVYVFKVCSLPENRFSVLVLSGYNAKILILSTTGLVTLQPQTFSQNMGKPKIGSIMDTAIITGHLKCV